jgi:phosphoheptose isomerase
MADLFACPRLLALFRQQAVRHVNQHFTWRGVAMALERVYADVRGGRTGRRRDGASSIDTGFAETIAALQAARDELHDDLELVAETIGGCFQRGGKLLICGNGGSAAEAQHFATELVGRFKCDGRRGLPAIALTADSAVLTAWANDCGFDDVFARQVDALGRAGDVLVGISTSGRSRNVIEGLRSACERGLTTIALLGGDGGELRDLADLALVVPAHDTQRIQEVQGVLVHLLCELVERLCLSGEGQEVSQVTPIETLLMPARRDSGRGRAGRRRHAVSQPAHGGAS